MYVEGRDHVRRRTICDDGHFVVVDGESLQGFRAGVDETETVDLSAREVEGRDARVRCAVDSDGSGGAIEDHFAVDQVVVGDRDAHGWWRV